MQGISYRGFQDEAVALDERALRDWQEGEEQSEIQAKRKRFARAMITNCLSRRQRVVVRMHYGFSKAEPVEHEDIGKRLGISVAEVDSIFNQALDELRGINRDFGEWLEGERSQASHMIEFLRTIQ